MKIKANKKVNGEINNFNYLYSKFIRAFIQYL